MKAKQLGAHLKKAMRTDISSLLHTRVRSYSCEIALQDIPS
ncbi:hypothetical protein B4098_2667 [Heyndrickxia coagulans]|uniref:Uncharacterized protein n=1 Tax=Heyndrickxia coagulans TaxID=1398 RepID=A0A150JQ47_HEYCO|nr:hypothetical protein BCO26_1916 [Heyndrickxia coagulans 2-6]KYC59425.1 hypothetical protein B4098_2667 [Heyndrickxia coagulans]